MRKLFKKIDKETIKLILSLFVIAGIIFYFYLDIQDAKKHPERYHGPGYETLYGDDNWTW